MSIKKKLILQITDNLSKYINTKYKIQSDKNKIIELLKSNMNINYFCNYKNCLTRGRFKNLTNKNKYCSEHKPIDYFSENKKCKLCYKIPSFGLKNKKPEYCDEHKPNNNYIDVINKTCKFTGCSRQRRFALENNPPEYCKEHKPNNNYINVRDKTCKLCYKIPIFGLPNSKKPEYCSEHKPNGYVDVKHTKCKFCERNPTFGFPNIKIPEYCSEHKIQGCIDLLHNLCKECGNIACYGIKNKKPEYCSIHKPNNNYVDVINKLCIQDGCKKYAMFGKIGTKNREYCGKHKPDGYVNTKNKPCIANNCGGNARFGKLFGDKIHCGKHKQTNEYYKNKPKCVFTKCKNKPSFTNDNNNYPLRCEDHKLSDDLDVISSVCSSCGLTDFIKTGNVCNDCSVFGVIRKKQENIVKQLLDDNKIQYNTYDKIIKDGCSAKRPDFTFDLGDRIIVLEVDENQHKSYLCECEQKRMIQIHQDYGGLDVCFIRYNPDNYKNNNNKTIKNNNNRHKQLLSTINSLKLHKPRYNLSVVYLYYDGYDGINKIEELKY
jgi:hypothetical protein